MKLASTNPLAPAADRRALTSEISGSTLRRHASGGGNEVHLVDGLKAPVVMAEIGRLRELTFRHGGGGTGRAADVDAFDTGEHRYLQLVLWNPADREIVGGYRWIRCDRVLSGGAPHLATAELFSMSDRFVRDFLPYTIELGRSFIQPRYQAGNRGGLFSLDGLWDGLGALIVDNPDVRYFFGKVTLYPTEGRALLHRFLERYFPDPDRLVRPRVPVEREACAFELDGLPYPQGRRALKSRLRELGTHVPPLLSAYMSLSTTMRCFGAARNDDFGHVDETAILVTIADIHPAKIARHLPA